MKVLVTGSQGFVGQNLLPYLKERHLDVVGLDKEAGADIQYCLGSFGTINHDLSEIETVIHLASESHVDRSISNPRPFIDHNVAGTLELFQICKDLPNIKSIILFSTDEVGACMEEGSMFEHFCFDVGSVYSATKGAQELLAQAYIKTFNLPVIITRCVNIFGSKQADEKLIPTICRHAIRDLPVPIYGSGFQERQWVHVDHVCDYLNYLCVSPFVPPKTVLHITGTRGIYNTMLARAILNLLGKPSSLISHVEDRKGHDARYSLGRSHKTDDFGCPEYDERLFMSDLEKTVSYYKGIYGTES